MYAFQNCLLSDNMVFYMAVTSQMLLKVMLLGPPGSPAKLPKKIPTYGGYFVPVTGSPFT